jgi:hypothetical protein
MNPLTAYTKGPWKFVHHNHQTKPSGQGQRYAVFAPVMNYLNRPDERFVFNIKLDKTQDLDLHREAEANARLISTAPEMLERLMHLRGMFGEYLKSRGEVGQLELAKIDYVINKALIPQPKHND